MLRLRRAAAPYGCGNEPRVTLLRRTGQNCFGLKLAELGKGRLNFGLDHSISLLQFKLLLR
jgi:hypothetical protein